MSEQEKNREEHLLEDEELENISGGVTGSMEIKSCPYCGSADVTQSKVSGTCHCFGCGSDFTVGGKKAGKNAKKPGKQTGVNTGLVMDGTVDAHWIEC